MKKITGLCSYHQAQVARSPAHAAVYWQRAMVLAADAWQQQQWPQAHQAFTCAFDIASLWVTDVGRGSRSSFGERELVTATQQWMSMAQRNNQAHAAKTALWFTYRYLCRQLCTPNTLARRAALKQYLQCVDEFSEHLGQIADVTLPLQ
ncbi:hypothetical protein [Simiduia aestuariiviva]|uniref:Uncharacterized protein n=1 Tax=Simiduia aestuariiviva TaxID=1510459 RepID=A0A839UKM4_9GAMM|nr:hypothetical protein [Simiduia aestuariiviva]MBB3167321.1 hypothetical protein [Simiduia aestuariiviva]